MNGVGGVSPVIGNDWDNRTASSVPRIARYIIDAPSTGASKLAITLYTGGKGSGSHIPLRFFIGTDPESHINANQSSESTGELTLESDWLTLAAEADALLLPGKTYYLWIFPGSDTFGWYWATRRGYASALTTYGAAMSDISAGDGILGEDHTISITRYSEKFLNRITAECDDNQITISDGTAENSVAWVPPVSWASQNPTGDSVLAKITCTTYDGDIEIGKTFQNVSFSIPKSVRPTVSFVLSDPKGYAGRYGGYVQNKSEVLVSANAFGSYGSEIKECRIKCGEKETSGFSASFNLPTAGSIPISVKVTDTRGRTAESASAVYVVAYSAPTVTIVDRYRSDENGNQVDDGSYAAVVFKANISPIYNRNSAKYAVKYRVKGRTTWEVVDADSYDGEYAPDNAVCIIPVNPDYAYEVCVEAKDNLSTVESLYRMVQVAFYGFSYNKHTKAVGIGQKATESGVCGFGIPAKFNAGVNVDGKNLIFTYNESIGGYVLMETEG
jgi:hypothetical protein